MDERTIFDRVLWAVDPLTRDKSLQETAVKVLKALSRSMNLKIQPLSIILEDQIPYIAGRHYSISDFNEQLETQLNHWLSQLHVPEMVKARLVVEKEFSIKSAVKTLLTFALENKYDLIVATTHAKKRETDTDWGTFAETLFLYSKTPLLLVAPEAQIPTSYHEIFFPTDLSLQSLNALKTVETLALRLKAHLTIFHKMFSFAKDVVEFPYSTDARSNYLAQLHSDNQVELETITNKLKNRGVAADYVIDRIEADYISKSILQRAKQIKDCFIAMAAHTGNEITSLPGSITRQVIRSASMPILVLYPKREL